MRSGPGVFGQFGVANEARIGGALVAVSKTGSIDDTRFRLKNMFEFCTFYFSQIFFQLLYWEIINLKVSLLDFRNYSVGETI